MPRCTVAPLLGVTVTVTVGVTVRVTVRVKSDQLAIGDESNGRLDQWHSPVSSGERTKLVVFQMTHEVALRLKKITDLV